jgi:hypothetical protein
MNIRSRGSIAVFLVSCVFFLFVFAASTVCADSGGESLPAARFAYRDGGTGGYGSPVTGATAYLTPVPEVHFVEVNGDGKTDLLVLERDTTEVRVLSHLSRGNGSFGTPGTFAIPLEHPDRTAFPLGDLNGAGLPDLVAHRYEKGEFTYNGIKAYLARGTGPFGAPVRRSCPRWCRGTRGFSSPR